MICVLVVAAGAAWESRALGLLATTPDVVVLKRCVDVDDLLATATAGQADAAVVALEAPGLDAAAVEHLHRHRVRLVAVTAADGGGATDAARARASRWGVATLVPETGLELLPGAVIASDVAVPVPDPGLGTRGTASAGGRILAVWGPQGAPGRTTVAVAVAAELAARGRRTLLVDADPYGGAVAQQLGVVDEVSGLLAAARLVGAGELADRFASVQRSLGDRLSVVTGLPRPDRWAEVRPGVVEQVLEAGRDRGDVVVDTGFSLEQDPTAELGPRPGRNGMTLAALELADGIIVVGSADPVGLTRLARGLVELGTVAGATPVHVLVNRQRATLGWTQAEVEDMLAGFAPVQGIHVLPDDRAAVDRALVAGRTLRECGDSALGRSVAGVVDAVVPGLGPTPGGGRFRRRTAGRGRRR